MYLQAVRIPTDKHLVGNSNEETKLKEILLKINSGDRYNGTKYIPYHTTLGSRINNGEVQQDFEMAINHSRQVIRQPREKVNISETDLKPPSGRNQRIRYKDTPTSHHRNGRRRKVIGDDESAYMEKSSKSFRNVTSTDRIQHTANQKTNKAILTHAEKRSSRINSSFVKYDRDLKALMRPSMTNVLPRAKRDCAEMANFSPLTSYANNKDTTAEESPTVEERAKFDTRLRPGYISDLSRSVLGGCQGSLVTVVVCRVIESQHNSESDSKISDAIVAPKISDHTADVVIKLPECVKGFCGHHSCRYGSNMNRYKDGKVKLSAADATLKNSKKSVSTKASKRRQSSSPDEGIVHSVDEMEDAELVNKMGRLEVANYDRTAITIEGGRVRESKLKKRSVKRERGNTKIKSNERNDAHKSESHSNDLTSKVSHNELVKGSASSPKTPVLQVSKAEKAIARKVVRQALNDNSVARSYKPVWVKLPNHVDNNHDQVKKRSSRGTKKPTVYEQHGAKDLDTGRTTRSKTHKNGVVHSHSIKEVSKMKVSKANRTDADNRRRDNFATRNDDTARLSSRRRDPEIKNTRNKSSVLKVSRQHRYRDISEHTQETRLVGYPNNKRTVSADSSVRDLSYSSSSSTSTSSSSVSKSTSSSFESETNSSSSYSSRSCYSNATSSSEDETHPDKVTDNCRQTRYKSDHVQPSNGGITRPRLKLHEYWRKNVRSKIKDLEAYTEALDLNSKRQVTRHAEKTFVPDEEQEFEISIGKKRARNRKHRVCSNNENAQESSWQDPRLAMASNQSLLPSSRRRYIEKYKLAATDQIELIKDIYSMQSTISDTQNGLVMAGYRRSDGMRIAVKRISRSGTTRWGSIDGRNVPLELALIFQVNKIRHSGVVEMIDWQESEDSFFLVMARPHPSVDLYEYVTKQKRLGEPIARRITKQLLAALLHCQKMGVLHRDVKLENILFNPLTGEAILIDFGCGDYFRSGSYREFAGTPEYYPPEWFLRRKYNGDSATVWSIGVLVYSILSGSLPFRSSKDIIHKNLTKFPANISHQARNFICEALKKKWSERITTKDIINHPWLKSSKEYYKVRKTSV